MGNLFFPAVGGWTNPMIELDAIRGDHSSRGENDGSCDHILQLPDIARPIMSHDSVQGVLPEGHGPFRPAEKALDQQRDVLPPFP